MSVNKAIIIGRLGADPEVRYTQSGQAVANFNVATDDVWTDKNGQKQERVEWHKIVVWARQAELCGEYLKKGREVYIEGSIQTREWQDRDGQRRWTTEIKAQNVRFLGGRADGGGAYQQPNPGGGGGQQQSYQTPSPQEPAYQNTAPAGPPSNAAPAAAEPAEAPKELPGPPGPEFNDDDIPF